MGKKAGLIIFLRGAAAAAAFIAAHPFDRGQPSLRLRTTPVLAASGANPTATPLLPPIGSLGAATPTPTATPTTAAVPTTPDSVASAPPADDAGPGQPPSPGEEVLGNAPSVLVLPEAAPLPAAPAPLPAGPAAARAPAPAAPA